MESPYDMRKQTRDKWVIAWLETAQQARVSDKYLLLFANSRRDSPESIELAKKIL